MDFTKEQKKNMILSQSDINQRFQSLSGTLDSDKIAPKVKLLLLKSFIDDVKIKIILLKGANKIENNEYIVQELEKGINNFIHLKNHLLLKRESFAEQYIALKAALKNKNKILQSHESRIDALHNEFNALKQKKDNSEGGLMKWFGLTNQPINRKPLEKIKYEDKENRRDLQLHLQRWPTQNKAEAQGGGVGVRA